MAVRLANDSEVRDTADDLMFDFDLTGVRSINDLNFGGIDLHSGKYVAYPRTILNKLHSVPSAVRLTFVISSGQFKGRQHKERLFLTDSGKPKTILFAKGLGLIDEGNCGMLGVGGSWAAAIGKEVVVEIGEDVYAKTLRTPNRASKTKIVGIWDLNDPFVADVIAGNAVSGYVRTQIGRTSCRERV